MSQSTASESGDGATVTPILTYELPPGTLVRRYAVVAKIGQGGMGVVYAARDSTLDRPLALKLVRGDRGGSNRLLGEAQNLAKLQHPNVVAVHDVGQFMDQVFIAMELMRMDLRGWLHERARSPREIVRMFLHAGQGLAAAHAKGLVHRDFKPENVLIGDDGRPRVSDFGLATSASQAKGRAGTPDYMAPEQARGATVDERADQFSFCVSLYEALYGRRPFPSPRDLQRPLPMLDLERGGRHVPTSVRRVLFKGLAENPDARFSSMSALLAALADDPELRRRRQQLVAAAAVTGVAAAAVIGWLLTRETPDERGRRECVERVATQAEQMWGQQRRAAVKAAFSAAKGDDLFTRIGERLDREVAVWRGDASAACRLALGTPERRRWTACLEERRKTLHSLSDLFATADAQVVTDAPNTLMLEVQPSETCRMGIARHGRAAPVDSEADERMRSGLARARVLKTAGKFDEALTQALEVLDEAADEQLPLVEAEAQLLAGEIHSQLRHAEAKGYLESALALGEALGNDELRARAWIAMMPTCLEAACDAAFAARMADTVVERLGRPPLLEASRLNAAGLIAFGRRDLETAEKAFREALQLREAHLPKDHPLIARSLNNLAWTLPDDRRVPVLESTLEVRRKLFGEGHPETAGAYHNLGEALLRVKRCAEASQRYSSALAVWQAGTDAARLGIEQRALAEAKVCLARLDDAIALLRLAIANLKAGNAPATERRRALELLIKLLTDTYRPPAEVEPLKDEIRDL